MRHTDLTLWGVFARRCGACLALLALMLQFGLSFGHVHPRDFSGEGIGRATADVAHAWRGPTTRQFATRLATAATDDDNCPICFSGYLLATSFIPAAPQPSPSLDFTDVRHAVMPAFDGVVGSDRAAFQPRAPPFG